MLRPGQNCWQVLPAARVAVLIDADAYFSAVAAAIVSSTVDLAHALGLRVVAEGIEDEATWTRLRTVGCDAAQGYYLSKPLAPGDLEASIDAISQRSHAASDERFSTA